MERPGRERMTDATIAASSSIRGGDAAARRVLFISAGASHTVALLCKSFRLLLGSLKLSLRTKSIAAPEGQYVLMHDVRNEDFGLVIDASCCWRWKLG